MMNILINVLSMIGALVIYHVVAPLIQEKIKTTFAKGLQDREFRHKLRLAAIEERLRVHQEAYKLSWDLFDNLHKEDNYQIVNDCIKWWRANAVYLTKEASIAFKEATFCVQMHPTLLQIWRDTKDNTEEHSRALKDVEENFIKLQYASNRIAASVELPNISDDYKAFK